MSETFDEQRRSSALLKRIVVVGVSGAGKTTLAQHLALHLDIPHVELDALFWEPNWTPVSPEIFRERVAQALCSDHWVTDGNFSQVRDLTWGRATTVIWLDYGVRTMLMRLMHRTFRRIFTHEELWNGNRETFHQGFFTRSGPVRFPPLVRPASKGGLIGALALRSMRLIASRDTPGWTRILTATS